MPLRVREGPGAAWAALDCCSRVQGAIAGLAAGLAMAFWIGIGSLVSNLQAAPSVPALSNSTDFPQASSLTTAIATTLLTSAPAPRR